MHIVLYMREISVEWLELRRRKCHAQTCRLLALPGPPRAGPRQPAAGQWHRGFEDPARGIAPPPLGDALADTCCAVRPGQALTLVREGQVVAQGRVGPLYAAAVPAGGESYRAYFDAVGFADSVVDGKALPYNAPGSLPGRAFDLYVIGDGVVTPFAPEVHIRDANPAKLAEHWHGKVSVTEFEVPVGGGARADIQVLRWWPQPDPTHGVVRITGPLILKAAFVRGRLEHLLRVDDVTYIVMTDNVPGTGACSATGPGAPRERDPGGTCAGASAAGRGAAGVLSYGNDQESCDTTYTWRSAGAHPGSRLLAEPTACRAAGRSGLPAQAVAWRFPTTSKSC